MSGIDDGYEYDEQAQERPVDDDVSGPPLPATTFTHEDVSHGTSSNAPSPPSALPRAKRSIRDVDSEESPAPDTVPVSGRKYAKRMPRRYYKGPDKPLNGEPCAEEDCGRKAVRCTGYCSIHGGGLTITCLHPGCNREVPQNSSRCQEHTSRYAQYKKNDLRNNICRYVENGHYVCYQLRHRFIDSAGKKCRNQMCEEHSRENYCQAILPQGERCSNLRNGLSNMCAMHKTHRMQIRLTTTAYPRAEVDLDSKEVDPEVKKILTSKRVMIMIQKENEDNARVM